MSLSAAFKELATMDIINAHAMDMVSGIEGMNPIEVSASEENGYINIYMDTDFSRAITAEIIRGMEMAGARVHFKEQGHYVADISGTEDLFANTHVHITKHDPSENVVFFKPTILAAA